MYGQLAIDILSLFLFIADEERVKEPKEDKDVLESEEKNKVITSERRLLDNSFLPSRERSRSIRKVYERQQRMSKSPVRSRDVVEDKNCNEKKETEKAYLILEKIF